MLPTAVPFHKLLLRWYEKNRRDLPWRVPPGAPADARPEAYHVLVSELMLQQTQVATVIPYFHRFLERFPDFETLAAAPEQDVLRLWQGLGYYSRARNLQAAARRVVNEFGGRVPDDLPSLLSLPGVGRYTAGAVASLAFDRRAPILDGNVARVLCRLDRIEDDPRQPATVKRLWLRAEEILPKKRVGDFNSALMELGATVCTPRTPRCLFCPVRDACEAFASGTQERIPVRRKVKPTPLVKRWTFAVRRGERWLIEQRPAKGRWAGMWQFVTVEPCEGEACDPVASKLLSFPVNGVRTLGEVTHALTHRRYSFSAFACEAADEPMATGARSGGGSRWRSWGRTRCLNHN